MGATTEIGWADATFNPIGGCTIASHGCNHCYAQRIAGSPRLANHPLYKGVTTPSKNGPMFNGKLTVAPDDHPIWTWPIRWRGSKYPKAGPGMPSTIFVGDMSDLFHENRPIAVIDKVIASIIYSRHIGQLLTKRADVMRAYFTELQKSGRWLDFNHPMFGKPNFDPAVAQYDTVFSKLWLGVSCEDQRRADERIPDLLATPAAIRFVSYEPALGPIEFESYEKLNDREGRRTWWLTGHWIEAGGDRVRSGDNARLDWIIFGGESGPGYREMKLEWHDSAAQQCSESGTAFFSKQGNGTRSGLKGQLAESRYVRKEFPAIRYVRPEPVQPEPEKAKAQWECLTCKGHFVYGMGETPKFCPYCGRQSLQIYALEKQGTLL